jgi:hypothetical protein
MEILLKNKGFGSEVAIAFSHRLTRSSKGRKPAPNYSASVLVEPKYSPFTSVVRSGDTFEPELAVPDPLKSIIRIAGLSIVSSPWYSKGRKAYSDCGAKYLWPESGFS